LLPLFYIMDYNGFFSIITHYNGKKMGIIT